MHSNLSFSVIIARPVIAVKPQLVVPVRYKSALV
jgi:hypothetical protein